MADKAIVLHVGAVENALSCMVQADGVVMGCSTFGQVAGLLSEGISMFSTRCEGFKTPPHYKMMPPLAVAERGHMWVPVAGSWHDPVLKATSIFRAALDMHVDGRNGPLLKLELTDDELADAPEASETGVTVKIASTNSGETRTGLTSTSERPGNSP